MIYPLLNVLSMTLLPMTIACLLMATVLYFGYPDDN